MKSKAVWISLVCLIFFIGIWFSDLETSSLVKNHINKGFELSNEGDVSNGSQEFLDGLVITSLHKEEYIEEESLLNSNLGKIAFWQKSYVEAEEYLMKVDGNYLLRGNGYYYHAEEEEDPSLKLELYASALDMYKQGIVDDPRNLDLKFNYEFVLSKLEQEEENQENSESEEGQDDQENQEGEESQEDQENQEGGEGQEDQENQEGEEGQEDQEGEEGQENQEGQEGNEDSEGQEGQEEGEQNTDQEVPEGQEDSGEVIEGELNEEEYNELLKILELLEQQEEESLKNNQEVIQEGSGDTNDW